MDYTKTPLTVSHSFLGFVIVSMVIVDVAGLRIVVCMCVCVCVCIVRLVGMLICLADIDFCLQLCLISTLGSTGRLQILSLCEIVIPDNLGVLVSSPMLTLL